MKREHTLRRKLDSLGMLGQAITAMKSLSAHHLRTSRAGLTAARAYRDGIDQAMAAAGIAQIPPKSGTPAILLLGADLGLCDGYNTRLVAAALDQCNNLGATRLYCVGRRPITALRRVPVPVERSYPAVTSVGGLTQLLLTLADDVLGDYMSGRFSSLHVVSARFDGVGAFTARSTRVLPVVPIHNVERLLAAPYVEPHHLAETAVREYVYSIFYELLLDALAAEHGMRLVATQAAEEWLETRINQLRRELASARRESSTQEVLDVASGARQRRHTALA